MLTLIAKDFKLLFSAKGSVKKRILSALVVLLMIGFVVGIEIFIFSTILDTVQTYRNATIPFMTVFLFIISCLMILLNTSRANKLFFDQKDIEQLTRRPVTNGQIVASKLVFLFLYHYLITLVLVYPVLIVYGNAMGKSLWFYYIGIFYPALSFLFEGGIALILVYPFKLLTDFLKKHTVVQFVLALVVMLGACILYNYVLSLFMELVVNNNLNKLFTQSSIDSMIQLRNHLIPLNFLVDLFFKGQLSRLFIYACMAGGVFIIGTAITVFSFSYLRSVAIHAKKSKEKEFLDIKTPMIALIKKELFLLFKDSNNIFSFTGLLIVQPFLVSIIIDSLNSVLSSGSFAYYMLEFPELLPLIDVIILMLFTLIINQGASDYIQMEKGNVRVMKTIPVSPLRQLSIKVLVPYSLSAASLLITVITLLIGGKISLMTGAFGFLLTLILLTIFDIVSLKEEMRISNHKPRSTFLSTCYSYLLPFSFFAVAVVSSVFGLDILWSYLLGGAVFALLGIPHVLNIKRKMENLFLDLEMVN